MSKILKNALVLFGSPHENGYTGELLNTLVKNLTDYKVHIINAYKVNIKPCIACGLCERTNKCIYNDFDEIDELLNTVDLIIIATPVYNLTFPSPLKAIFDRTQRYFSARFCRNIKPPITKNKKAVILLTCGSDEDFGVTVINAQLKKIFSVINATVIKEFVLKNTDNINKFDCLKQEIIDFSKLL